MTKEESILITAYTGYMLTENFSDVHELCEKVLGRPLFSHEFANEEVCAEIREKLRPMLKELRCDDKPITGDTSDGYHTFNELYHHRAVLFSVVVKAFPDKAWKARKHNDGSMFDGMFIVGIETPEGHATYHYDIEPYWNMFDCREIEYAPEWDGHTATQAIERIGKLEPVKRGRWIEKQSSIPWCEDDVEVYYECSVCGNTFCCKTNYCHDCGAIMKEEHTAEE